MRPGFSYPIDQKYRDWIQNYNIVYRLSNWFNLLGEIRKLRILELLVLSDHAQTP